MRRRAPQRSPSEFEFVSSSETKRASASLNFTQNPMADRVCRSYCITMESIIRRAALICAALSFGVFSSALQAQQTTPEQPQQQVPPSVPPAPPPDRETTPPPFPPMSRTAPRHRFVDMGGHRSARSHHASSAVRHPSAARHVGRHERQSATGLTKAELRRCKSLSHHQLRRNSKCQAALRSERAAKTENHHPAKAMSKAELRRCHRMSYRQLLQHKDCAELLQSELNSGHRSTHREKHKSAARRHKTEASSQSRKAVRHHGRRHRD
jgi:hypothetical protein